MSSGGQGKVGVGASAELRPGGCLQGRKQEVKPEARSRETRGSELRSQGPGPCSPSYSLPSLKNVFVSGLGQAGCSGLHIHHLSPHPNIPPEVRGWVVDLYAPHGDLLGPCPEGEKVLSWVSFFFEERIIVPVSGGVREGGS